MVQKEELEDYRKQLVSHIAQRELKNKVYISWISWFDDNTTTYFMKEPALEAIKKMRELDIDGYQAQIV